MKYLRPTRPSKLVEAEKRKLSWHSEPAEVRFSRGKIPGRGKSSHDFPMAAEAYQKKSFYQLDGRFSVCFPQMAIGEHHKILH
jgi:hypothetical protein